MNSSHFVATGNQARRMLKNGVTFLIQRINLLTLCMDILEPACYLQNTD